MSSTGVVPCIQRYTYRSDIVNWYNLCIICILSTSNTDTNADTELVHWNVPACILMYRNRTTNYVIMTHTFPHSLYRLVIMWSTLHRVTSTMLVLTCIIMGYFHRTCIRKCNTYKLIIIQISIKKYLKNYTYACNGPSDKWSILLHLWHFLKIISYII